MCSPGVLILALATALNATAFRVLDTMLFRGYAVVKDNDRLLYIDERSPNAGCCVAYFDFEHWQREAHAFQEMAFIAPRSIGLAEGRRRPNRRGLAERHLGSMCHGDHSGVTTELIS